MKFLILHSDPPTPCLHGMTKGLRDLGHATVCVGPPTDYGDRIQFQRLDPITWYARPMQDETFMQLTQRVNFFPDYVLFMQPNSLWLPYDLWECPVPTVAFLTEEVKDMRYDHRITKYFDVCVYTNSPEARQVSKPKLCWTTPTFNIALMQWVYPSANSGRRRTTEVAFVGHYGNGITTQRRDDAIQSMMTWAYAKGVDFKLGQRMWLRDLIDFYAETKIVWHIGGQTNSFCYRISEGMVAGAHVISERPKCELGLPNDAPVDGIHLTYYDDLESLRYFLLHYLNRDDFNRDIADAGRIYASNHSYVEETQRFIKTVLEPIPDDFRHHRPSDLDQTQTEDYATWLHR